MAGRFRTLTLSAAFVCLGAVGCFAQEPPATPANSPVEAGASKPAGKKGVLPEAARKAFENLTPEQQQKVKENFERWQNMTPEERKALREREQLRRQKVLQEIDDALKQSGLQLDDKTREMYAQRYTQARKIIEEKLQKEMDEKRRPQLEELISKLKTEFQDKSSPATSASPSPSAEATASPSK